MPLTLAGDGSMAGGSRGAFEEYNWGAVSAAAILITLPVLGFVFLVQRHLIRGLTAGGLR